MDYLFARLTRNSPFRGAKSLECLHHRRTERIDHSPPAIIMPIPSKCIYQAKDRRQLNSRLPANQAIRKPLSNFISQRIMVNESFSRNLPCQLRIFPALFERNQYQLLNPRNADTFANVLNIFSFPRTNVVRRKCIFHGER